MSIVKYLIKKTYKNNNINIHLKSNDNLIETKNSLDAYIENELEKNINPIVDGDCTIYTKNDNSTMNVYLYNRINNTFSNLLNVNNLISYQENTFYMIKLYSDVNLKKNIGKCIINISTKLQINDFIIYLPNTYKENIVYGGLYFFNGKTGKLSQLSKESNGTPIQLNDLYVTFNLNRVNKTFTLNNINSNIYEIILNNYNKRIEKNIDILPVSENNYNSGSKNIILDNGDTGKLTYQ